MASNRGFESLQIRHFAQPEWRVARRALHTHQRMRGRDMGKAAGFGAARPPLHCDGESPEQRESIPPDPPTPESNRDSVW